MPTRRRVLVALPLLAAGLGGARAMAAGPRVLVAPSTASILVVRAAIALPDAEVRVWRSPDELRAELVSGRADAVTLPSNVAANLAARGLPVQLVDLVAAGAMQIVARDPDVARLADLAGRRVHLYFRNDMPDLALRWLLRRQDLDRAVTLDHAGSATEVAQMLRIGRADVALLNEPAASVALLAAQAAGAPLRRAFTLQAAWTEATGETAPLPMAGLAVTAAFARARPDAVRALAAGTRAAADWARTDPDAAGRLAADRLGFRADATALALRHAAVTVEAAVDVRARLEAFLGALAELSPELIGGRLPDAAFYWRDRGPQ